MRIVIGVAVAAIALSSAGAAFAADETTAVAAQQAQPQEAKKDERQRLVCKTDEFVGSRIPRRVCRTQQEWDAAAVDSKDLLTRQLRGNNSRQPTGAGGN